MPDSIEPIDLRSDTVTRPSPGMRQAMAEAPVGDDQYGEDPSVNRLQQRIAEMLGKQAGLFVPSGTMANQIALKVLTRPGDEVLLGEDAHMMWHESGAGTANSGVQFTAIGRGGLFTAADLGAALKPPGQIVLPPTGLVAIENTHNFGGGVVFPQAAAVAVCAAAREAGIASYLDGPRLIAERLAGLRGIALDLATVQSNIVIFRLEEDLPDAAAIAARAREAGVLVSALGPRTVRAVTHLDVNGEQCRLAADRLAAIIERSW